MLYLQIYSILLFEFGFLSKDEINPGQQKRKKYKKNQGYFQKIIRRTNKSDKTPVFLCVKKAGNFTNLE